MACSLLLSRPVVSKVLKEGNIDMSEADLAATLLDMLPHPEIESELRLLSVAYENAGTAQQPKQLLQSVRHCRLERAHPHHPPGRAPAAATRCHREPLLCDARA